MSSVRKIGENFKSQIPDIPISIIIAVIIITVAFGGFSIGWIARGQTESQPIQKKTISLPRAGGQAGAAHLYVASENSDHFHYRWCSGAERIKAENKVYFASQEEAKASGREPAANCPGLQAQ